MGKFLVIDDTLLIITCIGIFILVATIFVLLILLSKKKNKINAEIDKIRIIDGKRYSTIDKVSKQAENVKITHIEKDVILERGKIYKVIKNGEIMPGKYTILSGDENTKAFNMRLNGFVREYKHNTDIILAEGDEISSVSHTTVLR